VRWLTVQADDESSHRVELPRNYYDRLRMIAYDMVTAAAVAGEISGIQAALQAYPAAFLRLSMGKNIHYFSPLLRLTSSSRLSNRTPYSFGS